MARISDRVLGQEASLRPLIKARAAGTLAATFIFAGPAGVGKHLSALALAQVLVCEHQGELACGKCGPCIRMEKGESESLLEVAPEGASIKIDQARDILQYITLRKTGMARIIIIDQAQLLNPQAANALLKSLEEPPAGTFFILLTANPAAILPTIRSRSQLIRFRPLDVQNLELVLGRIGLDVDDWLLNNAHGSVATAQKLAESRDDLRELEDVTSAYLKRSLGQFPGEEVVKLREILKDKGAQIYFFGLVQNVVRDSLRIRAGLISVQRAPWKEIAVDLANASAAALGSLAELSLRMESDIARNIDRGLVLENFALSWRNAKGA